MRALIIKYNIRHPLADDHLYILRADAVTISPFPDFALSAFFS